MAAIFYYLVMIPALFTGAAIVSDILELFIW